MQPVFKNARLTSLCSLLAIVIFATGCQERYKPSQWKAAERGVTPPSLDIPAAGIAATDTNNGGSLSGGSSANQPQNGWSTMPGRGFGSTLPYRGWSTLPGRGWSTLPGRGGSTLPMRNWSTLPARGWSTLPRGTGTRSVLPMPMAPGFRGSGGSTLPRRSGSTLPSRGLGGLEMPRPLTDSSLPLPRFSPLRAGSTLPARDNNPLR
ncbi:MAG: hypothetical protein AB8B55_23580 [Mariniblastus sp.]